MSAFRVAKWSDAASFLGEASSFLREREDSNAVVLGVAGRLAKKPALPGKECFFWLVYANEQPVAAALWTPPRTVAVTSGPKEALRLLAETIRAEHRDIPGVNGPVDGVDPFATCWCESTGQRAQVVHEMRIHRLDTLQPLDLPSGGLRRAGPEDLELVFSWLQQFGEDAGVPSSSSSAELVRLLAQPDPPFYFWCSEGQPVAMASWSRPTGNGISVNAVYTPRELRGNGYGTAVVHALSALLLDRGFRFCTLYTDLANPVSNAIYARIGYEPIENARRVEFIDSFLQ
jgi:predicted GNAT family acetyltransferase